MTSIELRSDKDVLALVYLQLPDKQDQELSDLLAQQREDSLDAAGKLRLEELLTLYRHGMIQKAEAIKTAVQRGLLPPLNEWDDDPLKIPDVKR